MSLSSDMVGVGMGWWAAGQFSFWGWQMRIESPKRVLCRHNRALCIALGILMVSSTYLCALSTFVHIFLELSHPFPPIRLLKIQ